METTSAKILVVDDDVHIANLISRFLSQKKYQVESANDGQTAIEIFKKFQPDLVILDINLPDTLGYNLCAEMQKNSDVFILMLTSRTDLEDKKKGFLTGADDYLTKPFDLEELEFRVQAILRRRRNFPLKQTKSKVLDFGRLSINPVTREVTVGGNPVVLTTLEFDLLYFLACNPNRVWTREELVAQVWQSTPMGDNRVVDVHIGQIRRKIEEDPSHPKFITTIRGVGYKFDYPGKQDDNNPSSTPHPNPPTS
ncbi:MAG: response regulator transcription factor [Geminocystis sp.]|nr:response regulator transcription factor [Geminocystis sp.]HIK38616.1 response regulator transcription factor [Geminocystis sp. M7585_C2015_104]MCS7147680.1 response regulator transcription factor [Geminocystis sp.]MCX8078477.1 response regulator transcription factor [Geminocystis sp.]MDW8117235.1 response regulator transcription factor [Geminocystis sp.]